MRADRLRSRIEQHEAAGAVGGFRHAAGEAGLAEQRGLLVARDPRDRDGRTEQVGRRRAEDVRIVVDLRQDRHRHAEQAAQLRVPVAGADVPEQCTGGVGDVGCVRRAAGEAPEQEAVDRAEGEVTALGTGARAGDGIEDPGDLGRGEIGIEQQAGRLAHAIFGAVAAERGADVGGAAVLPDDGAVDGFAGGAVPDDDGFALVGDADAGDVARAHAAGVDRLARGGQDVAPDILRIVLDPAGLRIMLREFGLATATRRACASNRIARVEVVP